jgi:hypothetical protein
VSLTVSAALLGGDHPLVETRVRERLDGGERPGFAERRLAENGNSGFR